MTCSAQTRDLRSSGFTLVEALFSLRITAILVLAMTNVIRVASSASAETASRNAHMQDTHFAMERMLRTVRTTSRLLVPLAANASTHWAESVRQPGVLSVPLPAQIDRDLDGFAEAGNDKGGRVDEDLPADTTNDSAAGVHRIDDNHVGLTDVIFVGTGDEDESGLTVNEDPINGLDNDGGGGGEDVYRAVDLSQCNASSFRFDYRRDDFDRASDYVTVVVSGDDANSWNELQVIEGPGTDNGLITAQHDLADFLSPDTRIRSLTSSSLSSTDYLYIDNVEVTCD